jgi:hypothetical protein
LQQPEALPLQVGLLHWVLVEQLLAVARRAEPLELVEVSCPEPLGA